MPIARSSHPLCLTILSLGLIAVGSSCSSDKAAAPAAAAGNTQFNSAVTSMNTAFAGVGGLMPSVATAATASSVDRDGIVHTLAVGAPPVFNDYWGVTGLIAHPMCSGGASDAHCGNGVGPVDVKDFLSYQVDPDAVRDNGSAINVFGRLKGSISQVCALMNLAPSVDANGYPSDGTVSVTFTTAMNSVLTTKCGFAAADLPPAGSTASFTISTPANTTYYDKKLRLDNDDGYQNFYFRTSATAVNIQSVEVNDRGRSRSLVALDRTTGALRAEYLAAPNAASDGTAMEFERVYYDPTANVGAMLVYDRDYKTDPTQVNRFALTLIGKPATPTAEAAVGFRANGYGGFVWANSIYKACFTQSTGAIPGGKDGINTCAGTTGIAANDAGPSAVMADVDGLVGSRINDSLETGTPSFTSALTVYSANTTHD